MKENKQAVEIVPLSKIQADANQPRKNFDPARLANLIGSIKKHGIMNPLIVEQKGNGYVLVDGERRFRSAQEIGLKEVPVIVVPAQSDAERLIQQFHIQEQHEGWSSVEKATAMARLAETLKVSTKELGKMLELPNRTVETYTAFASLLARKEFEKHETPIVYASRIVGLKIRVRRAFAKAEQEFTKEDEHDLELAIISRIKRGDIRTPKDVVKVGDAAQVDFESIRRFSKNDKMTVQRLFLDSQAKVAYHFRNISAAASMLQAHVGGGMKLKVQNLFEGNKSAIENLKKGRDALDELLAKV